MSGARARAEDALGATQPLGTATQPVDLSEITAVTPAVVDPPAHHHPAPGNPASGDPAPGRPAHGRPAHDVTQPVGHRIGSTQRMAAVTGRFPLAAYARLAKLDIVDYYLGVLLVWTLLAPALRLDGHVLATTAVFLLGEVFVIAAMVALDDLTGFRDGSDVTNYGPDDAKRKRVRKPLVAGTLTERQVIGFAWVTGLVGAALWTAATLMAPHSPPWVVVLIVVTYFFSLQYSWGVKLSYHGFQEFFIAGLGWALVLAPYGLAVGEVDGFALVQALLFGMGPLLFGVYSNTNDVAGDRSVGRPTVAALTTPSGNALFVMGLTTAEMALMVVAPVVGAPWWFLAAMTPTFCLRVAQLRTGFGRGDVLRARTLGIHTHRVTTAVLLVVNLVVR
ncbi:UbiA family prenyltransferase [Actinosynnema pretiosum subsp. pretiosum]|uniref:UbiA family prenyltransferase n=1 Tax=Actinosynnema pretiosum subsp. pretiosum TaxID=103721 RepID=A0AA45L754_9PSEU|nr:1,4-dihydroxy-2-naphthoate polyprenyltransferase [Actinosynnema pretiosum subsp. pretiosum]QUF04784.1 UbiA family prenyltransferase [Actinosynnema pretiosum subsp. pretiosum]